MGWGTLWFDRDGTQHRVGLLAKDLKSLREQWKRLHPRGPVFERKMAQQIAIFEAPSVIREADGADALAAKLAKGCMP